MPRARTRTFSTKVTEYDYPMLNSSPAIHEEIAGRPSRSSIGGLELATRARGASARYRRLKRVATVVGQPWS
jgi:hypothetical protein